MNRSFFKVNPGGLAVISRLVAALLFESW